MEVKWEEEEQKLEAEIRCCRPTGAIGRLFDGEDEQDGLPRGMRFLSRYPWVDKRNISQSTLADMRLQSSACYLLLASMHSS
jgi:hypothetical protein